MVTRVILANCDHKYITDEFNVWENSTRWDKIGECTRLKYKYSESISIQKCSVC